MEVLVIGSGGREHALCWKLAQSPEVTKVWAAPGNGGISGGAECVSIRADDFGALADFALSRGIGLTVVGPEQPLCIGIVDHFRAQGLNVFGPEKRAAEIEGNKTYCRELCKRHHIPSPQAWSFDDKDHAHAFLESHRGERLVVKASGLAAGKGVLLCEDHEEAHAAVTACMDEGRFGDAGARVVIEEFLTGTEISVLTLSDGKAILPLESAMDHKAAFDGDKGPNTGGMGAVSPAPSANPKTLHQVESQVLVQAVHSLGREGRPYQGVLYAGLMVTSLGPRLLEFNCRFGDPETQPLMLRFEDDLLPYLDAVARGKLDSISAGPRWDPRPAATVVAVADDYPGPYRKGQRIHGLDEVGDDEDLVVFHAGTERLPDGSVYTKGGRVLGVTARAKTLSGALDRCYEALETIQFSGMRYRTDIGRR